LPTAVPSQGAPTLKPYFESAAHLLMRARALGGDAGRPGIPDRAEAAPASKRLPLDLS